MELKVRNKVYKKAIARLEKFMSDNAIHWKQDIGYMKHLLEEKQSLENNEFINEFATQQKRLFDLCKEQKNELDELREFASLMAESLDLDEEENQIQCSVYLFNTKVFDLIKKVVNKYGKK